MVSSLFVLAQQGSTFSGVGGLVASSGPVAKAVLVFLALFSLVSWAIIIYKGLSLHRAHAQSETFLDVFRKSNKFSEVSAVCPQLKSSPLVGVFQAGYLELNQQVRGGTNKLRTELGPHDVGAGRVNPAQYTREDGEYVLTVTIGSDIRRVPYRMHSNRAEAT